MHRQPVEDLGEVGHRGDVELEQEAVVTRDPVALRDLGDVGDECGHLRELTGSGTIVAAMQDVGLEVAHEENLRRHYAMTLRDWCSNLVEHWDEAVTEVGVGTARVWGLYMASSRLAFERNEIQLHQVLATRTDDEGRSGFPLRPDWV